MGQDALGRAPMPEVELVRLARILARFLAGRQPAPAGMQVAGRYAGHGLDFLDFRAYEAGDDLRSVDWRASARSAGVLVRRYCGEAASDWFLCIDASASMSFAGGRKWQQARQLAQAFAYVQLHLGHRVALLLFSRNVDVYCPLGRGHAQYARIAGALAGHEPRARGGGSNLGNCIARLGRNSPALVISDLLAEDAMIPALTRMRARQGELHLLQVTDHQDVRLPDVDDLLLEDLESGRRSHWHNTGVLEASARLAALEREVAEWSRQHRVTFSSVRWDAHWRDVLLRHFMAG